jgi:hypothetical protein
MNRQLHLLPPTSQTWRLDAATREVGRKGLAQARAALRNARTAPERPPQPAPRPTSHSHLRTQLRKSAA